MVRPITQRDPTETLNLGVHDHVLVFDVGGHGVRVAVTDNRTGVLLRQGDLPEQHRTDTDANGAFESLLQRATAHLAVEQVTKVVIAAPGPVMRGRVEKLPTLYPHNVAALDLAAIGQRLWPEADLWITNDITAAGFALVAQGQRDFCVFNSGSGIGSKLFLNGLPLLGSTGMGGEIGHWQVPGAPQLPCGCGDIGHLGALGSGRGAVQLARYFAGEDPAAFSRSALAAACPDPARLDSHSLVKYARAGDAWSEAVIERAAAALGSALALIHLATGIEKFFLTGGFGTALGQPFAAAIGRHARAASWATGLDWNLAVTATDPAIEYGLVGAAQMTRFIAPDVRTTSQCA